MKPRIRHGALVGALLTAPVIAVSYLGWKLAGLPFIPFDVFDWLTRALPGAVVTVGIDSLVGAIRLMHIGSTATAAKAAEQAMAIATFVVGGAATGAVMFALLRLSDEPALLFGIILGGVLGVAALLIEQSMNRIPTGSLIEGAVVVTTMLAWGWAFGWVYDRFRRTGDRSGGEPRGAVNAVDRRQFLIRLGGATAATTFVAAAWGVMIRGARQFGFVERWSASHALPNAGASVKAVPGTRAELTPLEQHYRIDTNTRAPVLDERRWRLKVGGMVERPFDLTLEELRGYEPLHQFVTLACISNPTGGDLIGTTRWTGVSLQRLLPRLRVTAGTTHLKMTSADGFYEVVSLDVIDADPRVMLAYAWDGVPLSVEHGFPLRIYIPNVYGMKQPKWIRAIDAIERWQPGYWVTRGWDRDGEMKAASVVDTVAVRAKAEGGGGETLVPVGGIAHAGSRRISKVEVRADEGPWREAELRDPMSDTTWVVWRADLRLPPGDHIVSVRCWDGEGAPQRAAFHSKRATV